MTENSNSEDQERRGKEQRKEEEKRGREVGREEREREKKKRRHLGVIVMQLKMRHFRDCESSQ